MGFIPIFWVSAVAFLLRGALMNMAVPLYSAFAMERVGESEQATVNSVKEMAWTVGWVVGPIFSGYIQQRSGFTPLFVITAILYAGAIFLTQLFFKHTEQSVVNVDLEGAT
jgi:MFS family permease